MVYLWPMDRRERPCASSALVGRRPPDRPHRVAAAIRARRRAVPGADCRRNGAVRNLAIFSRRERPTGEDYGTHRQRDAIAGRLPGSATIEHYLGTVADAMARQPLLASFGCVLHDVAARCPAKSGMRARTAKGRGLPLAGKPPWKAARLISRRPPVRFVWRMGRTKAQAARRLLRWTVPRGVMHSVGWHALSFKRRAWESRIKHASSLEA